MGLKDWLAGNVAGPQTYGDVMGRQAREGGSALANVVFMSHGTRPTGSPTTIFDSTTEMEAAGFSPRFIEFPQEALDLDSLTTAEQWLIRSLQIAMISFAYIVNSKAALQHMRRDNMSKFQSGLGPSLLSSTVDCHLFDTIQTAQAEVLSYANLVNSASAAPILDLERPGS